ncbi:MAG TPA: hypothetical protein DIV86_04475 [Alphaproteobacteria bacterium]|nr:hypothetical protein [Alphaproteobacteria bacterium]
MKHDIENLKDNLLKLTEIQEQQVSIGDIADRLGASAGVLLAIVLATPMCLPFANIPGIAQAVSVAMGIIFLRYIQGKDTIWLPEKVRKTSLTNQNLKKICSFLLKSISKIEKFLHPRMLFLTSNASLKLLYSFCILMVIILALPLVIPLTNFFPGLAILLINFGIMQRDGYIIISGLITGVAGILFIAYVIIWGMRLVM